MPEDISEIIENIRELNDEHPKDGFSTPFIIEVPPRDPRYYQPYNNNPNESLWVERVINIGVTGPPTLIPNGEDWVDEETEEEMSGLKEWPQPDFYMSSVQEEDGIDALAWYRSFHYDQISKWGIYMLDQGIYYLAEIFEEGQYEPWERTPETKQDCINDAVNLLYYHELFHFYTDLAAANLEIVESKSMYVDYFKTRYPDGWLKPDGAPYDIPAKLEEALANEFSRKKTERRTRPLYNDTLREFMKCQPDGYKQWGAVKHNQRWHLALSQLGERILNQGNPLPQYMHVRALKDAIHKSYEWQVPVYIVDTIPEDIYRFATMSIFDKIGIFDSVMDKINHKKTPPNVRKNFHTTINKLRNWGSVTRNEKWNKTAKANTFFWKLSADAWRMCFVRDDDNPGHWDIIWVGPHNKYEKYRVTNNLN